MRSSFPTTTTADWSATPIRLLCCALLAFQIVFPAVAAPASVQQMPAGLADIQLGISLDDLRQKRNVSPVQLNSKVQTRVVAKLWMETGLAHEHCKSVLYSFSDGLRLEVVTAVRECFAEEASPILENFVRNCTRQWGTNYSVSLAELRHSGKSYLAPVMLWDKEGYVVAATFTPSGVRLPAAKAMFQISVFEKHITTQRLFRVRQGDCAAFEREITALIRTP